MILVLLLMIAGIITGVFIHRKPTLIRVNDQLISVAIYVLLFLLGVAVGLNKTIVENIGTLGLQALVITLGAMTGSVMVSWLIYKAFFYGKKNINVQDEE